MENMVVPVGTTGVNGLTLICKLEASLASDWMRSDIIHSDECYL